MAHEKKMLVRWTRPAFVDLQSLIAYIARDNPTAAHELLTEILDRVEHVRSFPFAGRNAPESDTRELVIRHYYLITYRVWRDQIEIINIWHTSQKRAFKI